MTTYSNETNRFLQDIAPKVEPLSFDTALYNYSGIQSIGSVERKFPIANMGDMGMFTCFGDVNCIQQKNLGALGKALKTSDKENKVIGTKIGKTKLKDLTKLLSKAKAKTKSYAKKSKNKNDTLEDSILLLRKECKSKVDKVKNKYKKNPIKGAKPLKKVMGSDVCVIRKDLVDLAYDTIKTGKGSGEKTKSDKKPSKETDKKPSGGRKPKPGDKGPARPNSSTTPSTSSGGEDYGPPLPENYPQGGELEPFEDSCEDGEEKNADGDCVPVKKKIWPWILIVGAVGVSGFLIYQAGIMNPQVEGE